MSNKIRPSQFPDAKGTIVETFLPGVGAISEGTAKPTDTSAGYEAGSIFIVRAGAAGANFYVNRGTRTSCSFKPLDLGGIDLSTLTTTATELNLLSGLLATAAEINRVAQLSTRVITLTASATLSSATHSDKMLVLSAIAGMTVTLPAPTGTGSRYSMSIGTTVTSVGYIITSSGANIFGALSQNTDSANGSSGFTVGQIPSASGITTITLDGSTKGGRKGDWLVIEDRYAAGYQIMGGMLNASGTEATPNS